MAAKGTTAATVGARALLERVGAAFGRHEPSGPARPGASVQGRANRCIGPIVDSLNLTAMDERVAEAMPHLEPIDSVEDLLAVFHHLGFAGSTRTMRLSELTDDDVPALVVRRDGSFGVVTGHTPDGGIRIYDPETDTENAQAPTMEAFDVTVFQSMAKTVDDGRSRQWFWSALGNLRRSIAAILALTFLANSLSILLPLYVMAVYNNVVATRSVDSLAFLLAGIVMAVAAEIGLKNLRTVAVARAGARFVSAVSMAAFARLLHLPIHMTQSAPVARQVARFRQFEALKDFFTGHLATAVFDLPFTLVFLVIIALVGGNLVWIPIVLMAVMALLAILTATYNKILNEEAAETRARAQGFQIETLSNAATIIDVGGQDIWLARYRRYTRDAMRAKYRAGVLNVSLHSLAQMLVMVAGMATLVFGALGVMAGTLTTGALIACMMIVWRVLSPVQVAFLSLNRITQFVASIRQVNQLMRLKAETDHLQGLRIQRRYLGAYRMEKVMFRYPGASDFALRGVSLHIERGEMIALAASSGAGKSTMLKLLLNLYSAQSGLLALDDIDMRQLDPREVRRSIGYVPQHLTFFHGTIAQNMRLVMPSATDRDIVDALNLAGIDCDKDRFPDGIDTRITGNQWSAMSSMQLQEFGLARAYVKKAPILLLDEPGTFLDRDGDMRFLDAIGMFQEKATIVLATNRPSHMMKCDRVVYLRDGMILGDGPPDEIVPKIEQTEARQNALRTRTVGER